MPLMACLTLIWQVLPPKLVTAMGGGRTDEGFLGAGMYFAPLLTDAARYAPTGGRGTRFALALDVALESQNETAAADGDNAGAADAKAGDEATADEAEDAAEEEDAYGMDEPTVAALAAQGDAAMEAGDFARALELYEAAKSERATLQPQRAMPRHGRRASSRNAPLPRAGPVVCTSTPSRRGHVPGAPTRREEVAARIAARESSTGR